MTSVRSRFSDAVGDCRMCSGRLFKPCCPSVARQLEAELGGDHHLVADRLQRLADQLLVGERAIDLGGVEEGHAALESGADQADRVLRVGGRAVAVAQAHAAEAEGRDFQPLLPSCAFASLFSDD